jgi:hypothetical protein
VEQPVLNPGGEVIDLDADDVIVESADDEEAAPFDAARFEKFCGDLYIDSKELGRVALKFLGGQRYLIEEIAKGLSEGIHTFVVLKGRQMGISTVLLALDMYWMFKNSGLQGAVITDSDENREVFRSYIDQYITSLPKHLRAPITRHNRVQLLLKNHSRLVYMVAGEKKKGSLGRAKSANFMHATECSSWGDEEGFLSLINILAQKNPKRLYVLESTARGYNAFYQTWEVAKESHTQKAIFIGWWRNEFYAWPEDAIEFKTYWDGVPTSDERVWIGEVFEKYGIEITPNQLAWWRWYVAEQMKGDEMMALQEMPPTEDYAFQLSGSKFFEAERVNQYYQRALKQECIHFKYTFGTQFEDTEFIETDAENAEVTIWETPAEDNKGVYVLGADPAYGSSEWADEFAGSLLRCYADRIVQVLEVGTTVWTESQFAWVIAHLCGWYGNCMLNLEMQGPGSTVFNELWNLKRLSGAYPRGDPRAGAYDVIGRIRDYLWKKQDALYGNFVYQWQTNAKEKIRMMSTLRSYFQRDAIEINSPKCLQQFRNIHRKGDQIGGEGRAKDDRVIALGIGTVAWNDAIMIEMQANHRTYAREQRPDEVAKQYSAAERSVLKFLETQKITVRGLNDRPKQ